MSTANLTPSSSIATQTALTIFWRFVWKEFRMLRGFWLAVGVLAILQQLLSAYLKVPGSDASGILFASGLAAAALYASGAAATMFAVEHEEETYSYLSNLPATWKPMFWGKLFVATISALALAMMLCIFARLIAGHWPQQQELLDYSGTFGIAILEALAWGTCLSLLIKRPLTAALFTIFAASAVVHLIVNYVAPHVTPSWYWQSYTAAIPWRLGVIAFVMIANIQLARRWWPNNLLRSQFSAHGSPISAHGSAVGSAEAQRSPIEPIFSALKENRVAKKVLALFNPPAKPGAEVGCFACRKLKPSRLRMIVRLLWQSWHESRAMMLLMLLATIFVGFAMVAILHGTTKHFIPWNEFPWLLPLAFCLFGGALFASSVFSADQRRQQYHFLAEHAARPRYVWLCRLVVWFSGFAVILLVGLVALGMFAGIEINAVTTRTAHDWFSASGASR